MHPRLLLPILLAVASIAAQAQDDPLGINALPEVPLSQLSAQDSSALGQAALAIRPQDWKHAETAHFMLHFFQNFVAARAATELEYYYGAITADLHCDASAWDRKPNVYIFESPDDWHAFQTGAHLDPWTGGIHSDGNLFIVRDPAYKFEGRSLGHETAHLVLYRFFGPDIPLWLNEGYAENSSIRFYAGLERERGYNSRPHSAVLTASNFIPIATLTSAVSYPDDVVQVSIFYQESEKLVGFLRAQSTDGFITFLDAMSHGSRFEDALAKAFGSRFSGMEDFEREFADFAQRQYAPLAGSGN
ncbi:MAG: hypothetical protein ABSE62_09590 [Chthoniobacteraceae bacterium]|jgi:hypothetical protein